MLFIPALALRAVVVWCLRYGVIILLEVYFAEITIKLNNFIADGVPILIHYVSGR